MAVMDVALCGVVTQLREQSQPTNWMDVRHESMVESTKETLTAVCSFLGQDVSSDYLDDCAAIVFETPRRTRHKVAWTPELIARTQTAIERFPFLTGYRFSS